MRHIRVHRIGTRLDIYRATLLDLRWLEGEMAAPRQRDLLIAV